MFRDASTRRQFLVRLGAMSTGITAAGSFVGTIANFFGPVPEREDAEVVRGVHRAAIVLADEGYDTSRMKHIIYDDELLTTPKCLRSDEVETFLPEPRDLKPWKTLLVWDKEFFELVGEIPAGGGKVLPNECLRLGAQWFALALRSTWPRAVWLNETAQCLEITESHGIVRQITGESEVVWAAPLAS